jgi:hypothetical protein
MPLFIIPEKDRIDSFLVDAMEQDDSENEDEVRRCFLYRSVSLLTVAIYRLLL